MAAKTVERIPAPSAEVFRERYLRVKEPVILTGLFAGEKIDEIRTEADARTAFGSVPLPVANEYLTSLMEAGSKGRTVPEAAETMGLADYLDHIRRYPGTRKMCSEKATPPELMQSFRLPAYDQWEDARTSFFVGNAGNFAHMHFDGDYRHVLFYQVFGDKRFILIPPFEGRKLNPIGNSASWSVESFSEEERRAFADFVNGYDCVVHAGETLYMPAGIWHFVEYTTTCMSFTLRFGRNRYTRFLADTFHMNLALQNIAWRMTDEDAVERDYEHVFSQLVAASKEPYASAQEKMIRLEALFEEICRSLYPNWDRGRYSPRDLEHLAKVYRAGSEERYKPPVDPRSLLYGWRPELFGTP